MPGAEWLRASTGASACYVGCSFASLLSTQACSQQGTSLELWAPGNAVMPLISDSLRQVFPGCLGQHMPDMPLVLPFRCRPFRLLGER